MRGVAEGSIYSVRLTEQGSEDKSFGWSIWRGEQELARSTKTFATIVEALLDAAGASASLLFDDGYSPATASSASCLPMRQVTCHPGIVCYKGSMPTLPIKASNARPKTSEVLDIAARYFVYKLTRSPGGAWSMVGAP
jgi:hypothetical protein